jgi:hypothetical protein
MMCDPGPFLKEDPRMAEEFWLAASNLAQDWIRTGKLVEMDKGSMIQADLAADPKGARRRAYSRNRRSNEERTDLDSAAHSAIGIRTAKSYLKPEENVDEEPAAPRKRPAYTKD